MRLSATLSTTELRSLAHAMLPLRIDLRQDDEDDPRWLDVDEPLDAKMIPNVGFSLATRAAVRWPERALFDEFRVERVELRIEPRLEPEDDGVALVVALHVGALDVAWVPNFVGEAVVKAINARLEQAGAELRWNFSGSLSVAFDEPGEHSNIERVCLDLRTAKLDITTDSIHLAAPMTIDVQHTPPEELAQRLH
jgi:hypothetical protein